MILVILLFTYIYLEKEKLNYLEKQADVIGSEINDLFSRNMLLIDFGTPLLNSQSYDYGSN